MGKCIEMIGKQYGKLTVISKSDRKNSTRHMWWNCLCSCGNTKEIVGHYLRKGFVTSCGCNRQDPERRQKHSLIKAKDGFHTASHKLFHRYKQNAEKRKYSFNLSFKAFQEIIVQPCHYCGVSSSIAIDVSLINEERKYRFNGVDRVDNTLGYSVENVVPCCSMCNNAKATSTTEEFLSWAKQLAIHQS